MNLHKIQNKNELAFSTPTIMERDLHNKMGEHKTEQSPKKQKKRKEKRKKDKHKKTRCSFEGCRKKLKLTDMPCRCQQLYCQKHRLPESHICSWNPKCADEMQKYVKTACLDKVIQFSKLESI